MVVNGAVNDTGRTLKMRYVLLGVAALALAACQPAVPDSAAGVPDPGRGVGFGSYDDYAAARDARLEGRATISGPIDVQATALDTGFEADGTARARAAAANSGIQPLDAAPGNPAPQVVTNAAGISSEQDFDAVSGQRDIQQDAALIAQNRAQYQVVTPTDLPTRPGTDRPNIVEYALRTTNAVGQPLYRRSTFRAETKFQRACAEYTSSDFAQEDFLASGGPERDRKGVDPDGDGFACNWDPAPFRAVRGG